LLTTPKPPHAQPNSLQLPHILGHTHKLWYTKRQQILSKHVRATNF
jgi:hypothetical protein